MATIYILFPKEHVELVKNALQHFQWAVERFEAMSERNALAKAALGVLHAIFLRLKKSLGISPQAAKAMLSSPVPPVTLAGLSPFPFGEPSPSAFGSLSTTTEVSPNNCDSLSPPSGGSGGSTLSSITPPLSTGDVFAESTLPAANGTGLDWSLPSDFDWASLAPIYATSDLVYNDLGMVLRDEHAVLPPSAWDVDLSGIPRVVTNVEGAGGGGLLGGQQQQQQPQHLDQQHATPFQFEGDFGNDSVWSLLNHYTPI